jgi:hypothetical protein
MRTFVTIVLVWAILIGFIVTGIRVMATPPSTATVQAVSDLTGNQSDAQRINPDRNSVKLDH